MSAILRSENGEVVDGDDYDSKRFLALILMTLIKRSAYYRMIQTNVKEEEL